LTYTHTLNEVTNASTKTAAVKYLKSDNFIRLILLPEQK